MIKTGKRKYFSENLIAWGFIAPTLAIIAMFMLYPIIQSVAISFFKWDGLTEWQYIGWYNYVKMVTRDDYFYIALRNTVLFAVCTVFGTIMIGFMLALFIDYRVRLWRMYRVLFFMAFAVSIYASALLWGKFFEPNGLLNDILGRIGLEHLQRAWFADPRTGLIIIIGVALWKWSAFPMMFFLAGMQNIPVELYEASKIDGASVIGRITKITMPMVKHVFKMLLVTQFIFSFKTFVIVFLITYGGPDHQTELLGTLLYQYGFFVNNPGYASVIAVFNIILALIFSFIYYRVSGYKEIIKKGNLSGTKL